MHSNKYRKNIFGCSAKIQNERHIFGRKQKKMARNSCATALLLLFLHVNFLKNGQLISLRFFAKTRQQPLWCFWNYGFWRANEFWWNIFRQRNFRANGAFNIKYHVQHFAWAGKQDLQRRKKINSRFFWKCVCSHLFCVGIHYKFDWKQAVQRLFRKRI